MTSSMEMLHVAIDEIDACGRHLRSAAELLNKARFRSDEVEEAFLRTMSELDKINEGIKEVIRENEEVIRENES